MGYLCYFIFFLKKVCSIQRKDHMFVKESNKVMGSWREGAPPNLNLNNA